ncbi:hypothetical protein MP228_010861 [Amoeboaphelidium protococcarum]|nr:hypothetical protein MP228_010861 [Amoeboaphelidium protococcarum]
MVSTQSYAAKYEASIEALKSQNVQDRISGSKFIKNAVIGNKNRKQLFMQMGLIQILVQMIMNPSESEEVRLQAVIIIGSLTYGSDEIIAALVQNGVIVPLLECLIQSSPGSEKLVEAAVKALRALFQHSVVPREDVFQDRYLRALTNLLQLIDGPQHNLATVSASVIARCAETVPQQNRVVRFNALPWLLKALQSAHPKAQESALDAISSLARSNAEVCKSIILMSIEQTPHFSNAFQLLMHFIHDKRPQMRLIACTTIVNLYKANAIPSHQEEVKINVLPALVKLLDEDKDAVIRERAPLILGLLVSDSESMQTSCTHNDAIKKLSQLLIANVKLRSDLEAESPDSDELKQADRIMENVLLCLASVSSKVEECRNQIISQKVLPHIVKALEHPSVAMRSAACQCARSLSRSLKTLRTNLVDANIAMPLFKLLSDENLQVKTTASATLCNIVLDFSPMKKVVLENGGVEKIVALIQSMDNDLRTNAVWALKNLLFQADADIKKTVMKHLTFGALEQLINDPEVIIQEQAINLLRNLVCGKEADIAEVFAGFGEQNLISLIEKKLHSESSGVIAQTLYVIVNISTGNESHKTAIVRNENILREIIRCTGHQDADIREATVWCIINLTWPDDVGTSGRVARLRQLGFEDRLRIMTSDSNDRVKDRVNTALPHFAAISGSGRPAAVGGSQSGNTTE